MTDRAAPVESRTTSALAYDMLRERVLKFELLPDQKLNEVELAEQMSISRTPLREALNRLTAEGILRRAGRSFQVPGLSPGDVRALFEARTEVEAATVRLACERASPEDLAAVSAYLDGSVRESPAASVDRLVELDCGFHEGIAGLAKSPELLRILRNLNDRIHLIRWVAMEGRRSGTQNQHRAILAAVAARDATGAEALMRRHILHRNDEILAAIRQAYAHVHTLHFEEDES